MNQNNIIHDHVSTSLEEDQPSGTIPYMAPEYLENKNVHYQASTEVYSFGVLLWEMFSDPELAKLGPYPNL